MHVAGHPELWRSPAMAAAAGAALSGAGIGVDDVAHLDLYSCFASSVCFALDALGIGEDDPRAAAVTVTGGLPYHGGPGSNYMTHSLAAMAETPAGRPRLVRRGQRRRHAHAEARLRRVVDRPGAGVVADPAPYVAAAAPVGIVGSPVGRGDGGDVLGAARARRRARAGAAGLRRA